MANKVEKSSIKLKIISADLMKKGKKVKASWSQTLAITNWLKVKDNSDSITGNGYGTESFGIIFVKFSKIIQADAYKDLADHVLM
jgi:hypothetical protein